MCHFIFNLGTPFFLHNRICFYITVYKKAPSDKMSGRNCIILKTTEKTLVQENRSHFWFNPNATIFIWSN